MTTKANFYIPQGTDWEEGVNFTNVDNSPLNITGYTFSGALKSSLFSNTVIANLTFTVLNAPVGNLGISMNASMTMNLSAGVYSYDAVMIDTTGSKTRFLDGIITILSSALVTPPNSGAPSNAIG